MVAQLRTWILQSYSYHSSDRPVIRKPLAHPNLGVFFTAILKPNFTAILIPLELPPRHQETVRKLLGNRGKFGVFIRNPNVTVILIPPKWPPWATPSTTFNTLQHTALHWATATHCSALQHTATHCNIFNFLALAPPRQSTPTAQRTRKFNMSPYVAVCCSVLQCVSRRDIV